VSETSFFLGAQGGSYLADKNMKDTQE